MDNVGRIITRRKLQDRLFNVFGIACTSLGIVTLLVLLFDLAYDGLSRIDWHFLTSFPSRHADQAGILSAWVGSVVILLVTAFTAVPLGIAAGLYLEEYATKNWLTSVIEINISNLAGVPSIIFGLMALELFVYLFGLGRSVLAGGLTLAVLILPIVIVATREALRTIPIYIREAAYSLGATKWQVIRHHLLPYSSGGIATGVIIALSRAIGETAPLITIGAVAFLGALPSPPLTGEFPFVSFEWLSSPFTVLPIQMFNWTSRPTEDFHVAAAAAGLVLIALTLSLNAVAILIRYRARRTDQMVVRNSMSAASSQRVSHGRIFSADRAPKHSVSTSSSPEVPVTSIAHAPPEGPFVPPPYKAEIRSLNFFYGDFQALKNINLLFAEHKVTALIGPSGCGKSTLLRCFNRIHDLYPGNRYEGEIILRPTGANIVSAAVDPIEMRMRIGMVFQKPNPFPKSIFENVAYGLRLKGIRNGGELRDRVEHALKRAAIFDEVKERLEKSAYDLSGGQQQRLCIARALATDPEILLFDEPTSALDPVATSYIEELVESLKEKVTIIIVTHNMAQASRVSDYTGFMYLGEIAEIGETVQVFENPRNKLTEEYITGRFG